MGSEALLERIVAAIGFPLQLLRSDLKIFNKRLPFGLMMVDDNLQLGVDLERCAATRTFHFEKGARGRHIGIVAQKKAGIGPALSFDCRMESVFSWLAQYGYPGLFILLMFGIVGLPVPDETLLVFCGYLIWKGRLHPDLTFLSGFLGSCCGISLSYIIGRKFGRKTIHRYGKYVHLTPERLHRVTGWFHRIGAWVLTIGYFVPGARHFTALVAGITHLKYWKFAGFAYGGAAIWVATFLTLGYFVGEGWEHATAVVHRYLLIGCGVCAVLGAIAWWIHKKRTSKKCATW